MPISSRIVKEEIRHWVEGSIEYTEYKYTYPDGVVEEILSRERIHDTSTVGENVDDLINSD